MYPVQYMNGPNVRVYAPPTTQDGVSTVPEHQPEQLGQPGHPSGKPGQNPHRMEGNRPPNLPTVNPPTSPNYAIAPPTLSPGYSVAPPPPSPGYSVAPPPLSPGYSVPPPFHQTNFRSTGGRLSPSCEVLPTGPAYSTSPGQLNKPAVSPNMLLPPPTRSPNLGYQPPSPTFSYFSSQAGSRHRTLIEVPRVDNAPPQPTRPSDNPSLAEDETHRSYQRAVSHGGVGGGQISPFTPLVSGSSVPNTRHSVESYTKLYDPPSTNNHVYDKANSQVHGYEPPIQGFQPINPGMQQCHDPGVQQCHDPGVQQCHDPGVQQCHDQESAGLVHGYENGGSTGFVHNYDQGVQGYEKQSTLFVNVQPFVSGGLEMGDPRINIAKSQLDPNVRPFTPSGKTFIQSNFHTFDTGYEPTDSASYRTCESETHSLNGEYEDGFQFNFEQEYDPLPQDPGSLLPCNLDMTADDPNNNVCSMQNKNLIQISTNNNNNNSTKDKNMKMKPDLRTIVTSTNTDRMVEENRLKEVRSSLMCQAASPLLHDIKWKNVQTSNNPPNSLLSGGFLSTSDVRRDTSEAESRHLVTGLEQSLHKWVTNQQVQMLQQQASSIEKIKRRMANGYMRGGNQQEQKAPANKVNSGGIFTQDLSLPSEYLMSSIIGDRIRPINIRQEHTDLLFFIFYTMHGDALQMVAASLLFERGWRFHKQQRIWLARWPGVRPEEKTASFEKGLYQYFDLASWKRIPGWFRLDYCHLAEKTIVPEDLKTLYTKYSNVIQNVNSTCRKSIALHGFNSIQENEELNEIEDIKYLTCIM